MGEVLKGLFIKRSSIKGQITKCKNYLDKITKQPTLTTVELAELSLKISRLEGLSIKFDDLQTQIELLNAENLDDEIDERECIEQDIISCTAIAKGLQETQNELIALEQEKRRRVSIFQETQGTHDHDNNIGLRLPQIEITKFDDSFFHWLEFHDTFSNLIHNNQRIPMIQKFHYLLSYLEGEARRIVTNIEVSSANYLNAWQLLCDRYNNKRLLINYHLKSLFNIQQITHETEGSLRFFVDHVSKNLRALANLGQPTDHWDTLIIFMLTSKLDSNTLMKWEEQRSHLDDIPTLEQFKSFLLDRAHVLESMHRNRDNYNNARFPQRMGVAGNSKQLNTSTKSFSSVSQNSSEFLCIICNQNHKIYDCPTFKSKNTKDKYTDINNYKLCSNCLRQGHPVSECRMGPCRYCKKRHNLLLHNNNTEAKVNSLEVQNKESIVNFSKEFNISQVLLSTALIEVVNPVTKEVLKVRALLDSGSQTTFITKSLQQKLSIEEMPTSLDIIGIGNCLASTVTKRCVVQFQSRDAITSFKSTCHCFVLDYLTGKLPKLPIDISKLNIPKNILLADPHFDQPAPIDVLIGADIFWDIIGHEQKSLGKGNPRLHYSQLGWLIGGQINPNMLSQSTKASSLVNKNNQNSVHKVHSNHVTFSKQALSKESQIDYCLPKFWELEELTQVSF